jgi:hypothetical protein
MKNKNLTVFLYLLMRDSLPTGEVARLVQIIEKNNDQEIIFTAKGLADYAEELAQRILKDK